MRDIAVAWNVQGNAQNAESLFGFKLPERPNTLVQLRTALALWLGPKSWLVLMDSAPCAFAEARDALNASGGALFDVSASRVAFTVRDAQVLAKRSPLDFHPDVFLAGTCAQSLFAGVNALFYRSGEAPEFTLLVARSAAREVAQVLNAEAAGRA